MEAYEDSLCLGLQMPRSASKNSGYQVIRRFWFGRESQNYNDSKVCRFNTLQAGEHDWL